MTGGRGVVAALGLCLVFCLLCIGYSLDRGLQLADESGYIYLLRHPDVVIQYADHRLWPLIGMAFGGGVWGYRLLAGLAVQAATLTLTLGALAVWRAAQPGAQGVFVGPVLLGMVGACGYFTALRPTMNYATTAIVFGDLAMAALLFDLARAPRRSSPVIGLLAGGAIALMTLGRFTAAPVALAIAAVVAMYRPGAGPWRARATIPVAALIGLLATLALLEVSGFAIIDTLRFGLALGGSTHDPATFLPRDIALVALVIGVGSVAAAATLAVTSAVGRDEGVRRRWRTGLAATFGVAVLVASLIDQHAVFANPAGSADPLANNRDLYGTSYGLWALAAYWPAMLLIARRHGGPSGQVWLLLFVLLAATALPFVGTNAGLLARTAMNTGPLLVATAIGAGEAARHRLVGAAVPPIQAVGAGVLMAVFVFLATIWSPAGVHGRAVEQTVRLDAPPALRGLRVSPAVARLATDLRAGLAGLGYDPARDRLLFGYGRPGLALLAGGDVAGPPWLYPIPAAQPQVCRDILASVRATRPRRLYGLDLDYQPALLRCLAAHGVDVAHVPARRLAGGTAVTIVTPSPDRPSPAPSPSVAAPARATR